MRRTVALDAVAEAVVIQPKHPCVNTVLIVPAMVKKIDSRLTQNQRIEDTFSPETTIWSALF